jgi:methylmalonyl-CoA/ethylmalonyl-CoA epimerase
LFAFCHWEQIYGKHCGGTKQISLPPFNFTTKHFMLNVEHIGIAVNSLAESVPLFEKLLNAPCYKTETVDTEAVNTAFFQKGQTKIELLESSTEDGVIKKFIARKGEGVHHIAFEVQDILAEMERLKGEGFVLLQDTPKNGADNKLVCFLHPKSTNAVLIELCQERKGGLVD